MNTIYHTSISYILIIDNIFVVFKCMCIFELNYKECLLNRNNCIDIFEKKLRKHIFTI